MQTSLQITEKLLCVDCEQSLAVDENVVAQLAGTAAAPSSLVSTMPRYFPDLGFLDVGTGLHVVRFAVSIFWRAHVSQQREFIRFRLPDNLAADFKRHLLVNAPLPNSHPLLVTALDYSKGVHKSTLVSFPQATTTREEYWAAFVMGGMIFEIRNGPTEEAWEAHMRLSISHGSRPWVIVKPWDYRPGMRKNAADFHNAR